MPRTKPERRVVHAPDVVEDAIRKEQLAKPSTPTPRRTKSLSYEQRLERRLDMAHLALNKYEKKLEGGIDLSPEEERLFLAHQDSIRKLETTLSALQAKNSHDDDDNLELALAMYDNGEEVAAIVRLMRSYAPDIEQKLQEALSEREKL